MTRKSTRASACALCAWSGGRDERHEHQHVQVLVLVLFVLGVGAGMRDMNINTR